MASQEAHRRVLGADVIGSAAHVMVGAGVVEEERYRLVQRPGGCFRRGRAIHQCPFQRRPAFEPELARERELHIAQGRGGRRVGKECANRARAAASFARIAFSQRLASFLRPSSERSSVIGRGMTFLRICLRSADRQAGRRFELLVEPAGWEIPCRGQEAPQRAREYDARFESGLSSQAVAIGCRNGPYHLD